MPESASLPKRLPSHTTTCMGCGPDNPHGLQMEVFRSGQQVYTDLVFDERHGGAPGLAHGGAIAAACDDLFGFTLWIVGTPAVTRNLAVGYRVRSAHGTQFRRWATELLKDGLMTRMSGARAAAPALQGP